MAAGRKRKPGVKPSLVPGMAQLPENQEWVTGQMHLRRVKYEPHTAKAEHEVVSMLDVETRLLRAMQTVRALPDRERRFFVVKSGHPDYVQEHIDAYASVEAIAPRFKPSPADVSDCLRALSWARALQKPAWKIVWWRSFGLSFGLIAKYIGRSDETARRQYKEAIIDAWAAANRLAAY